MSPGQFEELIKAVKGARGQLTFIIIQLAWISIMLSCAGVWLAWKL